MRLRLSCGFISCGEGSWVKYTYGVIFAAAASRDKPEHRPWPFGPHSVCPAIGLLAYQHVLLSLADLQTSPA